MFVGQGWSGQEKSRHLRPRDAYVINKLHSVTSTTGPQELRNKVRRRAQDFRCQIAFPHCQAGNDSFMHKLYQLEFRN